MSHDRGCYKCLRGQSEYVLCPRVDCVKKPAQNVEEKSKVNSYELDGYVQTVERVVEKKPKVNSYELDGYVIVPPLFSWDEKIAQLIIPEMAYGSFGKTATEAWMRHCNVSIEDINFSTKVQMWHDRGYRLKKTKLTIDMGE